MGGTKGWKTTPCEEDSLKYGTQMFEVPGEWIFLKLWDQMKTTSFFSLSLSPQRSQRDTLNFCACFQSCLYMQSKSVMICVRKTCTKEEEEDMWIKLVPTSGKKKKQTKSLGDLCLGVKN